MQLHMGTWASAIQSSQLDIEIRFGNGCNPVPDSLGDELRPVVRPDIGRDTAQDEQVARPQGNDG